MFRAEVTRYTWEYDEEAMQSEPGDGPNSPAKYHRDQVAKFDEEIARLEEIRRQIEKKRDEVKGLRDGVSTI